jgi:hypothetical protein
MYKQFFSRLWKNILIFSIGMLSAFVIFSFVTSDYQTTASIGDAFISSNNNSISIQTPILFVSWDNNILTLESLVSLWAGSWKSLRISLLYNNDIKSRIKDYLVSPYKISSSLSDGTIVLLIDMNTQDIISWTPIFSLSTIGILAKDKPIIESVLLFDKENIESLSVENRITYSDHH